MMTKFNVGDKVYITEGPGEGESGVIIEIDWGYIPYRIRTQSGYTTWKHADRVVGCSSKSNKTDRRLTEAEAKIKTLEAEVKALKDASKPTTIVVNPCVAKVSADVDIARIASEIAKGLAKVQQTPNQRRADVIKRAQVYLEEYDSCGTITNCDGFRAPTGIVCDVEFIVNAEKRTVVCLLRAQFSRNIEAKGNAKCAPGDVFNADIGKAIALGRAREVEVPAECYNAPQPTEFAVGQLTQDSDGDLYTITTIESDRARTKPGTFHWHHEFPLLKITDDTDAEYV